MKYEFAPIREAIFDIRITPLEQNSIEKLEQIHELIKDDYPEKKKQISFTGKIEFRDNKHEIQNESNSEIRGFLFSNKKHNRQIQARIDGFTFNMLQPYSNWETFSKEAFRIWEIYDRAINPDNISRIAIRYINKINIPLPFDNFQEYIINMPPIPTCLPQTFKNFFMQIEVPCDTEEANVLLTETIEQPSGDKLPLILDIDVYKTLNIDKNNLADYFNTFRDLKNKTFESCITDKTRSLFN